MQLLVEVDAEPGQLVCVAQACRIDHRVELAQVEALIRAQQYRASGERSGKVALEDAFGVLGLEPEASNQDVKTAYRRLMNQHHPDKLVARGLPKSMMRVAEEKTQEIRAAYERIKQHRGFK